MQKGDDLVALVAFAAASGVLSWTVSRLNEARRTAEQRERETQIRLDLTTRLMAGEDPDTVVAGAADALVALFGLVGVHAAGARARRPPRPRPGIAGQHHGGAHRAARGRGRPPAASTR